MRLHCCIYGKGEEYMIKKSRLVISLFVSLAILLILGMFAPVDNTKAAETKHEGYIEVDWEPTPSAYWQSSNKDVNTELVTPENYSSASNHKYFIGSKMFTKEDLPVGSIIEIDPGYQYRPDGWIKLELQPASARPGNVTKNVVVVDEEWWGNFQHRGFNIAVEGASTDIREIWEEVAPHFRIYVPLEDGNNDGDNNTYTEINWEPTPNAYWHSTNTGIGAQLSTPENSSATNHRFFIGSKLFSRADLPIGSIIKIDDGYQYRPDGYLSINPPQPGATRPANVTKNEVVVDEAWWGDYQYRGFNIAVEGGNTDITANWQDVASHFRILVPSDDENNGEDQDNDGNNGEDEDNDGNDGNSGEPIKLLAIGNSFSEDALTYLNSMAKADGVNIEVSILYIGGSELSAHWTNASLNRPVYTLIEYKDGKVNRSTGARIDSVLKSDDWDYVSLQQASHFSGIFSTYDPYLTNLERYVKSRVSEVEMLIHQTWAYESTSTHYGFIRFGKDPNVMFNQVSEAYKLAAKKLGNVKVIPSGLAMQNARSHELFDPSKGGKSLFRDGYHANYTHGRYLLASVWYEALTDNLISENTFRPASISDAELAVLKHEANKAVVEYTSEPVKLDLRADLNGLLWYEGEHYYKRPSNNEPVAELMPGERFNIQVDDLELFGNGEYEVGLLAAGARTTYEIEVNGEPIGTINRTANNLAMNNVTMTLLDETVVPLKKGDILTIIAPEDGKYESGWVDAVVLKNASLDDPDPIEEPEEPEKPGEEPEEPAGPGTDEPGEPKDPEQPGEDKDDVIIPSTTDKSGNGKLPKTATNVYNLLAQGAALLIIGIMSYFYTRRKAIN